MPKRSSKPDINQIAASIVAQTTHEKNPAAVAPMEDRIYIQAFRKDQFWYSRGIRPVGRDFIMRHHDAYGGPKPPPINHQGIDDAFVEKGSVIWYFYNGKWLKLSGAD